MFRNRLPSPRITTVFSPLLAAALIGSVALTACGTRTERQAASNQPVEGQSPATPETGNTAEPGASSIPTSAASSAVDPGAGVTKTPAQAAGAIPATGSGATASSPKAAPGAATSSGAAPKNAEKPTTPGALSPSPGAPAPQRPTPGVAAGKSPAVIASVGTISGPAGAALGGSVQALQVWTKAVNARGGVNGHPVQLIVYDDGGDPARHRAQVQDAIEAKHVIAFVQNNEAITGRPSLEYITQKRIPVIGSETGSPWFYDSPMYFPQATSGDLFPYTALASAAQQLLPEGKEKMGTLLCVEAQACGDVERTFKAYAGVLGFDYVYQANASLAQPDFTAECLNARNAGVETLVAFFDPNTIPRIGASCARQGYRPTFVVVGSVQADFQKSDPNLDGMVAGANVFAYFQTGTAATDEYRAAMTQFGSKVTPSLSASTGWVSAKLFEKAAANLSEPPTNDDVLRGLWSLKGDDLGGITQPLTFTEGQPATPLACWFNLRIVKKQWTSPDNFARPCRTEAQAKSKA